ncbi:hypothetical protein WN944_007267 [Citrus x changshan-huyou]|uniref:Uncharacterized protein n=1 Tax=Citrus x changshan-huyou TaxID=2935761 RepID=A0AAP0QQ99_9ROSI
MAGTRWFGLGQTHQNVNRRSILGSIHDIKCCSGTVNGRQQEHQQQNCNSPVSGICSQWGH